MLRAPMRSWHWAGHQPPRWPFEIDPNSWQARGLVGCWPFVNYQGAVNGDIAVHDLSLTKAHGTANATVATTSLAHPSGWRIASSDVFAEDTILACGVHPEHEVQAHTLVGWLMPGSGLIGAGRHMVAGVCDSILSAGVEWAFDGSPSGTFELGFAYYDGAARGWYDVSVGADPTASEHVMEHYAWAWEPGTFEAYRNGVSQGTAGTTSGTISYNSDTTDLWHASGTNNEYIGDTMEIRLYDRRLSDDEIWALYDPQTRWDLYRPRARKAFFVPAAGGATVPVLEYSHRRRRAA